MTEHFADWDGSIKIRPTCHCGEPRQRGYATCRIHREDSQSSVAPVRPEPEYDGPSEPDWEQIIEDRWADNFDEDAAQDRVDNAIYGP